MVCSRNQKKMIAIKLISRLSARHAERTIEKQWVGKSNSNGLLLHSLCASHDLAITNTMFRLPTRNKTTWIHPRSRHWHLIDYVITRAKDRWNVRVTKAMCGADCCTDHCLIISKLNFSIQPKALGEESPQETICKQTQMPWNCPKTPSKPGQQTREPPTQSCKCWREMGILQGSSLLRYPENPWPCSRHHPDTEVLRQADLPSVITVMRKAQPRWASHVSHMQDDRIPKQLYYGELWFRKPTVGGQRKHCKDSLKVSLKDFNGWFAVSRHQK